MNKSIGTIIKEGKSMKLGSIIKNAEKNLAPLNLNHSIEGGSK
jgi:hypothetical protein